MKSTGIIRRVDELGRVVIPIEIRNKFQIAEKDPIEIYVEGSSIILKKFLDRKRRKKFLEKGKNLSIFGFHWSRIHGRINGIKTEGEGSLWDGTG